MGDIILQQGCGLVQSGGGMVLFAVVGERPRVRRVIWSCGRGMLDFLKGNLFVSCNGHIACVCFVVPFEGEAGVDSAAPVRGDLVEAGYGGVQVIGVHIVNIFDFVVIQHEEKSYVAGLVVPHPWHVLGREVSKIFEVLDESVMRDLSGLGQAVHPLAYLEEDVVVFGKREDFLGVNNILGVHIDADVYVFLSRHWGFQVEVLDVRGHELGTRGGDYTFQG